MVHSHNRKVMVLRKIVKKKIQHKRSMPIKISFMHYMKSTRAMLPVVFDEFKVAYISFLVFSFYYHF